MYKRQEVTFLEYDYYVWDQQRQGKHVAYPVDAGWGRGDRPVIYVSWDDAKAYTEWLNEKDGLGTKPNEIYRLPTEAQWEYAARAGTESAYGWGKDFDQHKANCAPSGKKRTTPTRRSYPPNPWGLHDTAGNVWEWVEDQRQRADDSSRVLRGGSWYGLAWYCRAAGRDYLAPDYRGGYIGFRVCLGAPIEPPDAAPLNTDPLTR